MSRHKLDLTSDPKSFGKTKPSKNHTENDDADSPSASGDGEQKKFLGLKFTCCGVYSRVYVNREGTAYEGRCPKCLKHVRLAIGEGGTDSRFFEVY